MVTIRKWQPSDEAAVTDLATKILNEEFPKENSAFPVDDLNDVQSHYRRLGEAFFVATVNGKVIGTVAIKREDERTAFLRRLFVDSQYRSRRIGSQLVERAIEFCREVGYDELIFKTTSSMERAVHLCQGKGFVPRARVNLGPIQLCKYALFLKGEPSEVLNRPST
jgi:GNAT superfamily N-acetyltransferase